jgi:hypothetical protein
MCFFKDKQKKHFPFKSELISIPAISPKYQEKLSVDCQTIVLPLGN